MTRKISLILLLLLVIGRSFSWAAALPETNDMALAQNRLESMEKRKSAIERLKSKDMQNPEAIENLIQIVKNPSEPVALRAYTIDALLQMDKAFVRPGLQKIISDASMTSEIRKSVLHALWKQDPAGMKSELVGWAQSGYDQPDMRVAAIGYLSHNGGKDLPAKFWTELLLQKNPIPVRMAALNAMEELGLLGSDPALLPKLIRNAQEKEELRKSAVFIAGRILDPAALETEFVSILSNPNDSPQMKQYAVDNLAARPNPALLPTLENIRQRENATDLKKALEDLISQIKST